MSIRFVLGRAGSGKTHHCLGSLAALLEQGTEGPPLVFLVPEQATFQMERALLARTHGRAFARARVLSFRRLAAWVFGRAGGPSLPPIGEVQRRLLIRLILRRRLHDLEVFGRAATQLGFEAAAARLLSEFLRQRISPDSLRGAALALDDRTSTESSPRTYLSAKVRDLAILLEDYQREIAGRFTNPEETPEFLAQALARAPVLRGSRLWVDGFASFSAQELRALEEILAQIETAEICLCLDPRETLNMEALRAAGTAPLSRREDIRLFAETIHTCERLRGLVLDRRLALLPPLTLPEEKSLPRFAAAPDLAHLESQFPQPQPRPWQTSPASIHLVETASPRAQAEAAARELVRLHRERGFRWREMAILTRSLDANLSFLLPALREQGIPCFIDRRRSLDSHPLIAALRAATRIVFQGWQSADVIEFLKTGLTDLEAEAIDRIENYVLEHGITGRTAWTRPDDWTAWPRRRLDEEEMWEPDEADPRRDQTLAQVNAWRRAILERLASWEQTHFPRPDPAETEPRTIAGRRLALALADLLRRVNVAPRLEAWQRDAREQGNLAHAEDHRQALAVVLGALSEMALAIGDEPLTAAECVEVIECALAGLCIGIIPSGLDQVTIGSVDRSRQPELKACLVLGLAEGDFPGAHTQDPLLTDPEREALRSHGCEVSPPSVDLYLQESYYAYIAFTRPSEWLWVSRATADERGEELVPSLFWKRLRSLFPQLEPEEGRSCVRTWDEVATPQEWLAKFAEASPSSAAASAVVELFRERPTLLSRVIARQEDSLVFPRDAFLPIPSHAPDREARFARCLAALLRGPVPTTEAALESSLAEAALLEGNILSVSLSQIESFTSCPYQHFASYVLGLEERPEHRIELVDLGSLYHAILRLWIGQAIREGRDLAAASDDEIHHAIRGLTDLVAPRLKNELLLSNARFRYIIGLVKDTLVELARTIVASLRAGVFRPFGVEVAFGGGLRRLQPLELDLAGGRRLRFRGRIDRVDTAPADRGNVGVCVIDYKMSPRPLDLERVFYGLDLQLGGYLLALTRSPSMPEWLRERPVAVGAFYIPVRPALPRYTHPEDLEQETEDDRHSHRRFRGIFRAEWTDRIEPVAAGSAALFHLFKRNQNGTPAALQNDSIPGDDLDRILEHVARVLRQSAEALLEGRIEVAPAQHGGSVPCDYCPFAAVCRIDSLLTRARVLPKLGGRRAALDALRLGDTHAH